MIYTHDGPFHADDVFAVASLRLIREFRRPGRASQVRRTRDPAVLAGFDPVFDLDVMVDVGGVYRPERFQFDHHFVGSPKRDNGVPYAAFGMVWKHCAVRILTDPAYLDRDPAQRDAVAAIVERRLVQPIDAGDTGTALVADASQVFAGIQPYSIAHAVGAFNPAQDCDQDLAFSDAVSWAIRLLECEIERGWEEVTRRAAVRKAIEIHLAAVAADCLDGSPRVLTLRDFGPWQEAVLGDDRCGDILYVVYPSAGNWMVQGVPDAPGSFGQRKRLPAAWAGLRDDALATLTGVEGAVFCHPNCFIAGARTREGALALATLAVAT